jgi:hypothetical protein
MDDRPRYLVTYTTHDGREQTITVKTRFLPTHLAPLVSCGCANIGWTRIK